MYVKYIDVRNINIIHFSVNLVIMANWKKITIFREKKITSLYFDEMLNQSLAFSLFYQTAAKSRVAFLDIES